MSSSRPAERKVVVTGVGVVSPIGIGAETFWKNIQAGSSGIKEIKILPGVPVPHRVAGEVSDFDKKHCGAAHKKSIKVMCREIQLGVASATIALESAGIGEGTVAPERLGVEFGANLMFSPPDELASACYSCVPENEAEFHFEQWGGRGMKDMTPLWLLRYLPNMPACHIGIAADARGPNNSLTLEEASGNLVLGEALRILARNHADVMIAGSTGTRLHPVKSVHAVMWDKLADADLSDPAKLSRPFDRNRTGQIVAEGAATLILEEEEHARRRAVPVLGRLLGAGSACVTSRDGKPDIRRALVLAMTAALRDAGIAPAEIGHINTHGLGSPEGDRWESLAIRDVFGDCATKVPVTALKSYLGNSGSGCGTLEVAGSLLALRQGVIPATLNFETPDPDCPLNVVHGAHLPTSNKTFLKLSVTRMGQASAVVMAGV